MDRPDSGGERTFVRRQDGAWDGGGDSSADRGRRRARTAGDRTGRLAVVALLGLALAWGSSYFLVKDITARVPAADYLAVRFAVSAGVLFLIAPKAVARMRARTRWRAALLGALYGAGMLTQTVALGHTSASVSGFITALNIVVTPLLAAVLLKARIPGWTWLAVGVAFAGVSVLSFAGVSVGFGEALTLLTAVLFALHVVGLGAWSSSSEAMGMTIIQVAMVAAVSGVAAVPGGLAVPSAAADWGVLLYTAVVIGAAGMLAQTWAQAHISSTRTAIVLATEPVFASMFAIAFGGESLTSRLAIGGVMVVAATLLVELRPRQVGLPVSEVEISIDGHEVAAGVREAAQVLVAGVAEVSHQVMHGASPQVVMSGAGEVSRQ